LIWIKGSHRRAFRMERQAESAAGREVHTMKPRRQDEGRTARKDADRAPVIVDEEQRRRLAECCAYFLALRHRPWRPGGYRSGDLKEAEASIDAIIRKQNAQ
jgi:hypothetical protein